MSTSVCEPIEPLSLADETVSQTPKEDVALEIEAADTKNSRIEEQILQRPMNEIDAEGGESASPKTAAVVLASSAVAGDSEQGSSIVESCPDGLSDDIQQLHIHSVVDEIPASVDGDASTSTPAALTHGSTINTQSTSKGDARSNQSGAKAKSGKETTKDEKKEEKKKSKKKEDKSVEYILRALNSLQSPEEKLAALCKKYADLHEEHRVLQNSLKTQERTLTMVGREKDQIQSEHTKAVIAKSKLESLCRELQKHNKIIKDESINRAKEDDEKRKEISAQFNVTIGEIQSQMSDNSEKNNRLRKENDNLAEQLRTFISQCQGREEHVKKLQEHHDLEKKLAAAKLAQAEAILKEVEERSKKEKELMLLKLTEVTKKSHIVESQLEVYKTKYNEFNDLHTRSSETFQKYKTEMDKMTKRIKKLEKDGLQWKAKWESSSKALMEQYEARAKSEQETTVYAQKMKRLESLCRALQAELHGKKVVHKEADEEDAEKPSKPLQDDSSSSSAIPANSPHDSLSDQQSQDNAGQPSLESEVTSSHEPSTSCSSSASPDTAAGDVVTETVEASQNCLEKEAMSNNNSTDDDTNVLANTSRHKDVMPLSAVPESLSGGETEKPDDSPSEVTV